MSAVRFGVIGYGAWGAHHARVLHEHPQAEVTAICTTSQEKQNDARQSYPQARVVGSIEELLAGPVDAVAIVLPSHLHDKAGTAALEAGKHVLLEKPMTLSIDDCRKLVELADRKGRVLAIGHELRMSSLWGRVKQEIDAGAIGEPRHVLVELWRRPYRLGSDGWRYDLARVGSWILEEPIHFFDLARWYLSSSGDPVSVDARSSSNRPDRPDLADNFSAFLNFQNGAYAVVTQTLSGWEHHQGVKITGTEGALWASWSGAMDRTFHPMFWLKHRRGEELRTIEIEAPSGEVYELAQQADMMVRAIRGEVAPACSGRDGWWSVAMCLKAEESIAKGQPMSLDATKFFIKGSSR